MPNVPVLIKIVTNNGQIQSHTALTQSNGKYLADFSIDDNIQEAKAIIEVQDCNNILLSKTVFFSKSNPLADANFIWCASVGCELEVGIEKITNSNGILVLKAFASGGNPPYVYSWNTGQTTQTINISPNQKTYCVIVTDQDGCTGKACYDLVNQDDCSVEIEKVSLDNAGTKIKLVANAKGSAPFTYLWNTGETTPSIVPTSSGTYCVTITSADGCTAQTCITVEIKGDPDCGVEIKVVYDGGKAKLTAHAKGAAPFTYQWSNGATTESIIVEKPGEYCVNITDANGCESKACIQVKFPNTQDCIVKILILKTLDPSIVKLVAVTSGPGVFTYKWSNGATTQSILVEIPGEYCVVVTNAAGCEAKACVKLSNDTPKDCAVKIVKQPSVNVKTIILKAIPKGAGPFTYLWNTGATTQSIKIEKPGEYCVVVTDANGCEAKACIVIKGKDQGPKDCAVHIKIKPHDVAGAFNLVAITKGVPPFSFTWSTGESGQSIEVKAPGLYCVTVTNDQGCEAVTCIEIDKDGYTGPGQTDTGFKVLESYPQPAIYEVNFMVSMPYDGPLNLEVVNMNGELVQTAGFDYLEAGEHHFQLPIQNLSTGLFIVRLKTDSEQVLTKVIKTN